MGSAICTPPAAHGAQGRIQGAVPRLDGVVQSVRSGAFMVQLGNSAHPLGFFISLVSTKYVDPGE